MGLTDHQENELEIKEHNEFGSLEKKKNSSQPPPRHLNNKTEPHSICSECVSLLPASPPFNPLLELVFSSYLFQLHVFMSWYVLGYAAGQRLDICAVA